MVTWSGWALLEAIGRIVAGPEPLAAHGPEQPLASGHSQCLLFWAFFPPQARAQGQLCLSFCDSFTLENLLSSGEIFLSSFVPIRLSFLLCDRYSCWQQAAEAEIHLFSNLLRF